ncbi:MAG TPA: nitroreductase family protein [Candidatus Cloacimonadota bacterium]|nr:nitroreductase family protein [Candidatus Cloacimonadota bacterium]
MSSYRTLAISMRVPFPFRLCGFGRAVKAIILSEKEFIMAGIVFLKTAQYARIKEFYGGYLGLPVWLDQGTCIVYQSDNQLLGFCQAESADLGGIITFFLPHRDLVDKAYARHAGIATGVPQLNRKYKIYHFWAQDPEGRSLEFQSFEHPLEPYLPLDQGLISRRSIRKYLPEPVPEELLNRVFELCRYSPTARNMQGHYYLVIRNREVLQQIVAERGPAGNPILASPYAIAVCARGELSRRVIQDACIAATYLLLAAQAYNLGTCWVTDMDKDAVKRLLNVPAADYIACLTPIGYPAESLPVPERQPVSSMVRVIE